jgi:hypothetical protein
MPSLLKFEANVDVVPRYRPRCFLLNFFQLTLCDRPVYELQMIPVFDTASLNNMRINKFLCLELVYILCIKLKL